MRARLREAILRYPERVALVCCALVFIVVVTILTAWIQTSDGVGTQPTAPVESPLPAGLDPVVVQLDGQLYRCVVTYNEHGVDCDWGHPVAASPTPTPSQTPQGAR